MKYYSANFIAIKTFIYRLLNLCLRSVALCLVYGYRYFISPLFPASCRFHPTCSAYGRDAFKMHGFVQGTILTLKRVGKCHPWHRHPNFYDPVPTHPFKKNLRSF